MPLIKIRQDLPNDQWTATFVDDQEVYDLFGTYTLPTPFRACAAAEKVHAEVSSRNPDCQVETILPV